jgi:hypothetical protein
MSKKGTLCCTWMTTNDHDFPFGIEVGIRPGGEVMGIVLGSPIGHCPVGNCLTRVSNIRTLDSVVSGGLFNLWG